MTPKERVDYAIKTTRSGLEAGLMPASAPQAVLAAEVERLRQLLTPDADAAIARVKDALNHLHYSVRDPLAEGIGTDELPVGSDAVEALDYANDLLTKAVEGMRTRLDARSDP